MKKTLTVLMMVLLAAMLFISCDNKTKEVAYKVTFESNGGSAVATEEVKAGEKAVKPENPTREGYTFDKWTTDKDGKYEYAFNTVLEGDITLYAQWSKTSYTVGDTGPAGGIIVYVNPNAATDGWTYLEAAPTDAVVGEETTFMFGYYYNGSTPGDSPDTFVTEDGIGKGNSNTAKLLETADKRYTGSSSGSVKVDNFAPKVASEYSTGSVTSGWFLPSIAELKLMWAMKTELGMNAETYLSSTEISTVSVVTTSDKPVLNSKGDKAITANSKAAVRAVRTF